MVLNLSVAPVEGQNTAHAGIYGLPDPFSPDEGEVISAAEWARLLLSKAVLEPETRFWRHSRPKKKNWSGSREPSPRPVRQAISGPMRTWADRRKENGLLQTPVYLKRPIYRQAAKERLKTKRPTHGDIIVLVVACVCHSFRTSRHSSARNPLPFPRKARHSDPIKYRPREDA